MGAPDPTGQDWTDDEIDLIVADYMEMLSLELAGRQFVKAHRNAALQERTRRSRGSIEFKHQNISAALLKLGLPWIVGYKPMWNFQRRLVDGIERFIERRPDTLDVGVLLARKAERTSRGVAEEEALFIEMPPPLAAKDVEIPEALDRLVRRFDPAARDARNRVLGKRGEERIYLHERASLKTAGRDDLARRVKWVSEELGDGAGYDILSFDATGRERLLEVKTTVGHATTPFFLSESERSFSDERPDAFRLVRLYDFARVPRAFELKPPLASCVLLTPTNYRASFGSHD